MKTDDLITFFCSSIITGNSVTDNCQEVSAFE